MIAHSWVLEYRLLRNSRYNLCHSRRFDLGEQRVESLGSTWRKRREDEREIRRNERLEKGSDEVGPLVWEEQCAETTNYEVCPAQAKAT